MWNKETDKPRGLYGSSLETRWFQGWIPPNHNQRSFVLEKWLSMSRMDLRAVYVFGMCFAPAWVRSIAECVHSTGLQKEQPKCTEWSSLFPTKIWVRYQMQPEQAVGWIWKASAIPHDKTSGLPFRVAHVCFCLQSIWWFNSTGPFSIAQDCWMMCARNGEYMTPLTCVTTKRRITSGCRTYISGGGHQFFAHRTSTWREGSASSSVLWPVFPWEYTGTALYLNYILASAA